MKKNPWLLLLWLLISVPVFASGDPDSFQIEVKPSTFAVNQSVDITIKAIKNNQVMKNYIGNGFLEINGVVDGKKITYEDYVVPSDGYIDMTASDQGVKTFSKGVKLTKAGNFTVDMESVTNGAISGSTTIIVTSDAKLTQKEISVLSPIPGGKEDKAAMSIIASAPELPNARMQILLNDLAIKEWTTDAAGLLSETVSGLKLGTNYIQIKAISVAGEVVGLSDKVVFTYQPGSTDLFKGITATPNQNLKLWDKVRFEVITEENVSSAKLIFSWGQEYPLDKQKNWLFTKDIMLTQTGEISVSASFSAGEGLAKTYDQILTLQAKDSLKIWEVKIISHQELPWALQISRETLGGASEKYGIKYGIAADALSGLVLTTWDSAILSGFTYGKEYFFQVLGVTNDNIPEGLPSEVISFVMPVATGTAPTKEALSGSALVEPQPEATTESQEMPSAPKLPTCVIKNIKVSTEKIWNKYYLVRKPWEHIEKYRVYRSDFSDMSNKTFLWETEVPRYEYPFDKTVEEDVYAYYSVEAICTDGQKVEITHAKKVQVGPLEDMMLVLASTALLYLIYRVYTYRSY